MNIDIRMVAGKFNEASIIGDGGSIHTGLLDEPETLTLAKELIGAASQLLSNIGRNIESTKLDDISEAI